MDYLRVGSLLQNGKYRILNVLGQGGYGITYLAANISFGTTVAIKEFFIKDAYRRNPSTNEIITTQNGELINKLKHKFLHEAKRLHNLDHPNIVKVNDFFEENDTCYFVMDYIEGQSLRSLIETNGPLDEAKAKVYVSQIAEALDYIHSKKITHLDIKPDNIMVRECDDKPFLIDFGISKKFNSDNKAETTTPIGVSKGFAPIEQYDGTSASSFTPGSDVYALGATLYFILTGCTPKPASERLIDSELKFTVSLTETTKELINYAMTPSLDNRLNSVRPFINTTNEWIEFTSQTKFQKSNKASWRFASISLFAPLLFSIAYIFFNMGVPYGLPSVFIMNSFHKSVPIYSLAIGIPLLISQLLLIFIYNSKFSLVSIVPTLIGIALPFLLMRFTHTYSTENFLGDTFNIINYDTEYLLLGMILGFGVLTFGEIKFMHFSRIKVVITSFLSLCILAIFYSWKFTKIENGYENNFYTTIIPIIVYILLYNSRDFIKSTKRKTYTPIKHDNIEGTNLEREGNYTKKI